MKVSDIVRIAALTMALHVGIDLSHEPADRTGYWEPPAPPKKPVRKDRAKIKAARKQRNRK